MDDKIVTIAEFQSDLEAQMAKAALQENGIDAIIVGGPIMNLLPADGMWNVQLQVFARDAERAGAVLDAQQNQPGPEEGIS
ncbi:MAG: hypothetical protein DRP65_03815 [Planctomycetota bacterium]|nr:MAG: hypothetical protein DRP65_03815 [Planctomycetota bacterium]